MSSLTNDIIFLQNRLGDLLNCVLKDLVIVVASSIVLLLINWKVGLGFFMVLPILALPMGQIGKKISEDDIERLEDDFGRV